MNSMSQETFVRDGFKFEAEAFYEAPEPGNGMCAQWNIEIGEITITDSKEMIDAYGLAEAIIMMCDMEEYVLANESDDIIGECSK